MKMLRDSLVGLNYWYSVTIDYYSSTADCIVINVNTEYEEQVYLFERFPAFCYIEGIRDYGMKYTRSLDYLQVINTLEQYYGNNRIWPSDLGVNYVKDHTGTSFNHNRPGNVRKTARPF